MDLFFFKLFSHLGCYIILSRVPCTVLVICLKYTSVHMSGGVHVLSLSMFHIGLGGGNSSQHGRQDYCSPRMEF